MSSTRVQAPIVELAFDGGAYELGAADDRAISVMRLRKSFG
ncbi:MAG TPA: hypothetical protein VHB68_12490 [Steroidobacteraceae bacterium]|nr:hypothetical protein [Steroidobacteraceae bacterium]